LNEFVAVAVVSSISPKDGLLKLKLYSDFTQQILNTDCFYIDFFGNIRKIFIEKVVRRSGNFFLKIKNFSEERELKIFLNKEILLPKDSFLLDENSYLISDLLNCQVFYKKKLLGIVENVLDVPMNNVLVIRNKNNKEMMIPFVLKFFEKINIEEKKIYLSTESKFLQDEN
jgi:16S rRNA processing protein RimM